MALKQFWSILSNSRRGSPLKVAHSKYKQETNLVLTNVYKVNYPKQRSHIMSKTNLRLVFSSKFKFIGVCSLTQELVKTCMRERLSVLSGLTQQPCQAYVIDNQKLKTMVLPSTTRLKFIQMCNWKQSRYLDVGQYRPISIFSHHLACFQVLAQKSPSCPSK